mgnify:CR=1 FL=1
MKLGIVEGGDITIIMREDKFKGENYKIKRVLPTIDV